MSLRFLVGLVKRRRKTAILNVQKTDFSNFFNKVTSNAEKEHSFTFALRCKRRIISVAPTLVTKAWTAGFNIQEWNAKLPQVTFKMNRISMIRAITYCSSTCVCWVISVRRIFQRKRFDREASAIAQSTVAKRASGRNFRKCPLAVDCLWPMKQSYMFMNAWHTML